MAGHSLRSNTKRAEIANRRKIVAANLLAGHSQKSMAAGLGVSEATISADVKKILAEMRESYQEMLAVYTFLQLKRLDVLLNAVWEGARNGQKPHLDSALHIIDRQNEVMGIKGGQGVDQARATQPVQINIVGVPHREGIPDVT